MNVRLSDRRSGRAALTLAVLTLGCSETRNLGSTVPHGLLPVDERNPILLANDGAYDNWQGEYAVLLANAGGPKLAGIIVNTSGPWPDLDTNMAGWRGLVTAATASGLRNIPDPQSSTGPPLTVERPDQGHDSEPVGGRAHDRQLVRQPEPPLPAAGRRDGRPLDGCRGRLPAR